MYSLPKAESFLKDAFVRVFLSQQQKQNHNVRNDGLTKDIQ